MEKDITTKKDIIKTLEEIKKSLQNDIESAIDLYMKHFFRTGEGIGLFAIPRLIFPEIDNLGSYYAGEIKNTAKNAINFIKDYFSKVNIEYKRKGAFIYLIYRHGLIHQHIPKFMSYKRKNIGWVIGLSGKRTKSSHLKMYGKSVQIDGRQFYDDLIGALEFYKKDIKDEKDNLIDKFIMSHNEMMKPVAKTEFLKKKYLKQSDFDFLKK